MPNQTINGQIPPPAKRGRKPTKYWKHGYTGYQYALTKSEMIKAAQHLARHGIKGTTRHNPVGYPEGYYVFVVGAVDQVNTHTSPLYY